MDKESNFYDERLNQGIEGLFKLAETNFKFNARAIFPKVFSKSAKAAAAAPMAVSHGEPRFVRP